MALLAARGRVGDAVVVGLERGLGVLECGGAPEDEEGWAGRVLGERWRRLWLSQLGCCLGLALIPAPALPEGCGVLDLHWPCVVVLFGGV